MAKRILLIGACYYDTVLTVPHFPSEDSKLRATSQTDRRGGNAPNTAEVLSQLFDIAPDDLRVSLCVALPSRWSRNQQHLMETLDGVDLAPCKYHRDAREPARSYIVRSEETGSRTIVNYNPLPEMTKSDWAEGVTEASKDLAWIHFEGRLPKQTWEFMKDCRELLRSLKLSVEIEKPGREGLEDLAMHADVVFYSRSWAEEKGHKSAEECLRAQVAAHQAYWANRTVTLYCTWGADGATALEYPSMSVAQVPAQSIRRESIVDTIGAGDTFIAGILYCTMLTEAFSLADKLYFANELAGHKVRQEGFLGLATKAAQSIIPSLRLRETGQIEK